MTGLAFAAPEGDVIAVNDHGQGEAEGSSRHPARGTKPFRRNPRRNRFTFLLHLAAAVERWANHAH